MRKSSRAALAGAALLTATLLAPAAWAVPIAFNYTGSLHSFTADTTGTYVITAFGAQGGNARNGQTGGLGAEVSGQFLLTAGEILAVAVGGAGASSPDISAAGGGGGGVGVGSTPFTGGGGGLLGWRRRQTL